MTESVMQIEGKYIFGKHEVHAAERFIAYSFLDFGAGGANYAWEDISTPDEYLYVEMIRFGLEEYLDQDKFHALLSQWGGKVVAEEISEL